MWQMAWIWSLVPTAAITWVVNITVILGIVGFMAGTIGRWVPFFSQYAGPLKLLGTILLVVGIYFKGGADVETMWRTKSAELEAKIAVSEQQSRDANTKLDVAIKEKNQAIRESKLAVQSKLKNAAVRIDAECKLDPEAVEILNDSAKDIVKKKAKK